jgi:hypothetical protein
LNRGGEGGRRGGNGDAARQPQPKTQEDKKEESTSTAVYCKQCQTWLNGPRQWEDHKIGKKHRKNVQKEKAAATSNTTAPASTKPSSAIEEPEMKTDMWEWLEQGRKDKVEEKKARRRRFRKKDLEEDGEPGDAAAAGLFLLHLVFAALLQPLPHVSLHLGLLNGT